MRLVTLAATTAVSVLIAISPSSAAVLFFPGDVNPNSRNDWLAAHGQAITTLTFENGAPGQSVSSPALATSFSDRGVSFRSFGNGTFPQIVTGLGGVPTSGSLWLGNLPAPGFAESNAISWDFTEVVFSFGFYDVASPGGPDGFEVSLFDTNTNLLGSFNTVESGLAPRFWGFISDSPIGRVSIRPEIGNGFIGIDDLQFTTKTSVPEPISTLGTGVALGIGALLLRKKR